MANYNKVLLMGNLTRDPELRYTAGGLAIAKFCLAINRKWRTEAGEEREEATFVDVDAFGRQAETIAQYMKKGRPLFMEGRLKLDQWEDKTTHQKRSRLGVILESFSFVDSGNRDASGFPADAGRPAQRSVAPTAPTAAPASPPSEPDAPPPIEEDDVPF